MNHTIKTFPVLCEFLYGKVHKSGIKVWSFEKVNKDGSREFITIQNFPIPVLFSVRKDQYLNWKQWHIEATRINL